MGIGLVSFCLLRNLINYLHKLIRFRFVMSQRNNLPHTNAFFRIASFALGLSSLVSHFHLFFGQRGGLHGIAGAVSSRSSMRIQLFPLQ
jgi:hypothetical protein